MGWFAFVHAVPGLFALLAGQSQHPLPSAFSEAHYPEIGLGPQYRRQLMVSFVQKHLSFGALELLVLPGSNDTQMHLLKAAPVGASTLI